jgi:hypothetical protein
MNPEQQRLLKAAPELLVVELTDTALGTLITALLLEHPTADHASPRTTPQTPARAPCSPHRAPSAACSA